MNEVHKIIFLDIDGVLNCAPTWQGEHCDGAFTLDPVLCDEFARVIKATNAVVVLSSTWRLYPKHMKKLDEWLGDRGIKIHSSTPDLSKYAAWNDTRRSQPRGMEIKTWLDSNCPNAKYVILDDDCDMLPEQQKFFVQTSFFKGLTKELADKAIKILAE